MTDIAAWFKRLVRRPRRDSGAGTTRSVADERADRVRSATRVADVYRGEYFPR